MTPKRLPRLQIVPVHDLKEGAFSAFQGARYHLETLKELLNTRAFQTKWDDDKKLAPDERNRLQADVSAFHWHLRAFFWELVGAFDSILLWANMRFSLEIKGKKINERDVRWRTVSWATATKDPNIWDQKKEILQATRDSDWFYDVVEYRNFAHRSFLILQVEYGPPEGDTDAPYQLKLIWLLPARRADPEGDEAEPPQQDLIEQLSGFISEMDKLGKSIFGDQVP